MTSTSSRLAAPGEVFRINPAPIAWVLAAIFALAAIVESVSPTPLPKTIDCLITMVLCIGIAGLAHSGRYELAANLLATVVAIVVNWLLWNSVVGSYNIVAWALPVVVMFSVLSCRRAVAIALTLLQCVSFISLMIYDARPESPTYVLYPYVQFDRIIYGLFVLGITHVVCEFLIHRFSQARRREAELIAQLVELNQSLESRVSERTAALDQVNAELRSTNQELEAFTYTAAHDLRSPLGVITGFIDLTLRTDGESLPARAFERLQNVLRASREMSSLIDALLAFSRLKHAPLQRDLIDMTALAEEIVIRLRADGQFANAVVEVEPGMVADADRALLRALLENLIGNALKYSQRAAQPRVSIGRDAAARGVTFVVRDNGIGFDPARAERLFEPFQRLHSAAGFSGTGVGLASVKRIVERHGGWVDATAVPGNGASFRFSFGP
jgi:signal transduction histidine kinase